MLNANKLCELANITPQTFYRLIRTNEDFKIFVEANRIKRGNSYAYKEEVLEWLSEYYQKAPADESEVEARSADTSAPERAVADEAAYNALKEEKERLEREIERLTGELEKKEQERLSLFGQNAQLLLLLSQEKQEKQMLLPAPRTPVLERIRAAFTKKKAQKPSDE